LLQVNLGLPHPPQAVPLPQHAPLGKALDTSSASFLGTFPKGKAYLWEGFRAKKEAAVAASLGYLF